MCVKCQGKSERHERMMDLTVEIEGDIETLEEALHRFTRTEILDGENKYLCGRLVYYIFSLKLFTDCIDIIIMHKELKLNFYGDNCILKVKHCYFFIC